MELEWASVGRALIFLGIPFVLLTYYLQWRWARICDRNIQVLEALAGGGGKWVLAPKEGGKVSIRNSQTGDIKTWMLNELATIDVLYPGVGFIPKFLQKSIRLAIVNEGDWEPLLNRSPHRKKIASPDVIQFLLDMQEEVKSKAPKVKDAITDFLEGMSTSPTRELIAPPEAIGNLEKMGVLRALATVSDDLLEALKGIRHQLTRFMGINPTVIYIGMGLTLILVVFLVYQMMQAPGITGADDIAIKIDQIHKALGIGGQ